MLLFEKPDEEEMDTFSVCIIVSSLISVIDIFVRSYAGIESLQEEMDMHFAQ